MRTPGASLGAAGRRTGSHVSDGARQHAQPGAGHVAGQVDRGEAVQVVAQRQRQQRRQPQQRHHLRWVQGSGFACLEHVAERQRQQRRQP